MQASDLIKKMLSSETKGDLVVLFHKNPGLIDNIEGVARRIGKRAQEIQKDLDELVEIGLLGTRSIGNSKLVYLNKKRDKEIQKTIADFLKKEKVT